MLWLVHCPLSLEGNIFKACLISAYPEVKQALTSFLENFQKGVAFFREIAIIDMHRFLGA